MRSYIRNYGKARAFLASFLLLVMQNAEAGKEPELRNCCNVK
jgi:hypothetical protein